MLRDNPSPQGRVDAAGGRVGETSQEKRAACDCKRPKFREETPKEGGGNARRYRTATR